MAGCPFYHNSLRADVKEIVYNLIDNTSLSLKVVLRDLVNNLWRYHHLAEGVSVLKGLWSKGQPPSFSGHVGAPLNANSDWIAHNSH